MGEKVVDTEERRRGQKLEGKKLGEGGVMTMILIIMIIIRTTLKK